MSLVTGPERRYTPDELLLMPDGDRYELVDGHLVEPNVSAISNAVEAKLCGKLEQFNEAGSHGWVFTSGDMYRCFPHRPNLIRKPDVSFLRSDRAGIDLFRRRIVTIGPDLAVEVVSPNDEAEELEIKIDDYLKAGVRLAWVIYPVARKARVFRRDGSIVGLSEVDELDGEDVSPGFRVSLGALIPTEQAPGE